MRTRMMLMAMVAAGLSVCPPGGSVGVVQDTQEVAKQRINAPVEIAKQRINCPTSIG